MRRTGKIFIAASIAFFILSAAKLDSALSPDRAREPAPASTQPTEKELSADAENGGERYAYLLKNENGRVMLYSAENGGQPVETAISYPDLPPEDRALLDRGIAISSERQLLSVIEDYTS